MHINFGTMARLFLTNITPKSEKADIDVEHEPEHARDKENVDDVKNLEKDVEDATTEVKPEQELDTKQEEGRMDPKDLEATKEDDEKQHEESGKVDDVEEDKGTAPETGDSPDNKPNQTDAAPNDATESNKEPVGVWTAEEEDVPREAPAKESVEEEEDNTAQLKEEGKEDGSSTDDIVGEDDIENEFNTNSVIL